MRWLVFCAAALSGGCVSVSSELLPEASLTMVANRVECELGRAYDQLQPRYKWLKDWKAVFTLTVKQEDSAGIAPGFAYGIPVGSGGFALGAGGTLSQKGTRTITTKRSVNLTDIKAPDCDLIDENVSPLAGRLDIADPLRAALQTREDRDPFKEKPDDLGYTIDFLLIASGHVNPVFAFAHVSGLGADFSLSRQKTHTLAIALVDASPEPETKNVIIGKDSKGKAITRRVITSPPLAPDDAADALRRRMQLNTLRLQ